MPMLTSTGNGAIQFNPEFFDQSDIDRLMALHAPEGVAAPLQVTRLAPMFDLSALNAGDAQALFDADATRDALNQSLAILMEDPDYRAAIEQGGQDALIKDAGENLATQLKTGSISDEVASNNKAARDSVQLVTDPDGLLALEVAGTRLLTVNPSLLRGPRFDLVLQVAAVVLDIFALICTAIGIAIEHGSGWIKRIAEYMKGFGQSMLDWGGKMLGKAGTWMSELSAAHGGPQWMTKVKAFARQIGTFVLDALKLGWSNRHFVNTIRYAFSNLFAGPWYKKAYYLLQLIASVILFVGTAGASLMVKIVLAVIQLALLIWDSIVLHQMLHPSPSPARAAATS